MTMLDGIDLSECATKDLRWLLAAAEQVPGATADAVAIRAELARRKAA